MCTNIKWRPPPTPVISKISVGVAFIALVLGSIALLPHHWIEAEYVLPETPGVLPEALYIETHMGLLEGCSVIKVKTPDGFKTIDDKCQSDDPFEFQKTATPLVFTGAFISTASFILVILNITVVRIVRSLWPKIATAFCSFATVCFVGAGLIMHLKNRRLQMHPGVPVKVKYDIDWAFVVTTISVSFWGLHTCLVLAEIYMFRSSNRSDDSLLDKDAREPPPKYGIETS